MCNCGEKKMGTKSLFTISKTKEKFVPFQKVDFSIRLLNAIFTMKAKHTGCGSSVPWICKTYGLRWSWQTQKRNFEKIKQSGRSGDPTLSSDKFKFCCEDSLYTGHFFLP